LAIFDGAGGVTARDTVSTNGEISRRAGAGSYTVNTNCTGSAAIGDGFGKVSFDFMIVPGTAGGEFSFIVTNQGTVQTGVALKVGDKRCNEASLRGTYRVLGAGTNALQAAVPRSRARLSQRWSSALILQRANR